MAGPDDHPSEAVDIGIGGPALHDRRGSGAPEPRDRPRRTMAPWKIIAAIVGVAAAVSLLFGAVAGNDRSVDRALPEPTATATSTAAPAIGGTPGASPGPEIEMVPIVGQGLSRAGDRCELPSPDGSATISFVVPDGLTARCGSVVEFWTDPVSARTSDPLPLALVIDDGDLQSWFVHWTEHRLPDRLNWRPLAGRRGWVARFNRMTATGPDADEVLGALDLQVIEVPGGTVVVDWFHDARSTPDGLDLRTPFEQLVDSLTVSADPHENHYLPEPGGWCSGDHHVARIPVGWFASPSCGAMNTSSEGPIVLRCNACHPPLWIDSLTIAFDADYGFTQVDVDEVIDRHDGVPVRVIEGLRPDGNNMERPLRAMIIDGGPRRIAVMASPFPQHVLPGHTWEETLAAQQFVVDQLRFHSSPDCGVGQRWVASGSDSVLLDVGWGTRWSVPAGAALIGTGCTRRESGDLEVRLEADPRIIGWIGADAVRSPTPALCPTGEGAFDPRQWDLAAEGDFDGDGRADQAYVARPFDGAPTFTDSPTLAVLFANGGLAEGTIGATEGDLGDPGDLGTGAPITTAELTARRLIGMGRDLLELRYVAADGFLTVDLRDPVTCDMGPVARGHVDLGEPATRGVCVDERAPSWTVMRSWTVIPTPGRLVEGSDVRWYARNGEVIIEAVSADAVPPCGPVLEPQRSAGVPAPDTLAGTHPLTLQWAASSDGSVGEVTFVPIGGHRYQVEGSHVAAPGASLELLGVVRHVTRDELDFDGVVITQVAQLYGGEPCVRSAGQRFVRRPGTNVFRMQDRINCDGARTDWIDITLPG